MTALVADGGGLDQAVLYFWVVLAAVFTAAGATHIALAITNSVLWPVWVALAQLVVAGGCARAAVQARP